MTILYFAQFQNAYRYTSDSLLLLDFVLKLGVKGEVLDVGAGCGIIGIMLKYYAKNIHLSLLEIQQENMLLIQRNLEYNNLEAEVFHSDFKNFTAKKKFDCVVSNPPFYQKGVLQSMNRHKNISKNEFFLPLEDFLAKANFHLKSKASLYFCYEASALTRLCMLLEKHKLKPSAIRFVHTNKNRKARLILVKARKNVASHCEILPPLYVYKGNDFSQEMQEIHSRFKVRSYDF
ncbi:methyltransferase [Campylobacter sp. MIT 21-1685]|uniref:tRNA1(Val) (adenine(37)-N6)-methyltransferase n=1 Tax=unclassified Campylobacter TaxID=2593542 RepID=UPI00224B0BE5|nr:MULTISPECIES: methyltransferase [unclassified Campylobacter]MCX2683224.1 methyltransferase [Campylobacter sp. MIT 21-1684]MCX2751456.1 methyltransferase [Campylobacter sp. MIT 21-1682]MCX2807705.1 methyltransferase [Campylobacter sp. MIT 21-1685]